MTTYAATTTHNNQGRWRLETHHISSLRYVSFNLAAQGGSGKPAMMKTGPNNASGIVWAISEFFFSFFFMLY